MATDRPNKRRPNVGGIIAGAAVALLGALFLLNALSIAPIPNLNIGTLWPLILIVIGGWRLMASRGRRLTFPIALIAIGALFLLIGFIDFSVIWAFWPLILIAVGILIAVRAIRGGRRGDGDARRQSDPFTPSGGGAIIDVDVPAVNMEGVHTTAPDFVDGKADFNVVMGKADVDFRNVTLTRKPSTLEVSVVMGQALIHAPPEWVVQVNASATMGECKDTRPQSGTAGADPDLIINGSVVMGSLHID